MSAKPGDFAEAVLLPGDPLRARHIAEEYLDDAREVNAVRNMLGFTGEYHGMRVSVMGTGMGIPSAAIYITELITEYGVERLVRVGSAGGVADDVGLRDIVVAMGASTDSAVNRRRYAGMDFAATADFALLRALVEAGEALGIPARVGNVHTSDLFYAPDAEVVFGAVKNMGTLAVEMETAGLYGIAAQHGARAASVLTVSDHIFTGESTTSDERQTSFTAMVQLALEGLKRDAG